MGYDKEKRIFIVRNYIKFNNITKVQRAWRSQFNNIPAPSRTAILYNVSKFEKTGSVEYIHRVQPTPTQKREDAKNVINNMVSENPRLSIRKLALTTEVSYSTVRNILVDALHLKPFKFQIYHELQPGDFSKRVDFAQWFLKLPQYAVDFFICSDEAYFYINEPINKQNNRLWLKEKPEDTIERPLHEEHFMVWCAFSARNVFGPYIFEGSVNQHSYLQMLQTYFWPKLLHVRDYKKYWFQQDGASAHTAIAVQEWLTDKFSTKFVNKFRWPSRSPDLNPCDFFVGIS
jgi:hypothetical protein